jgi:surfeit locus 1 family protein
VSRARRLLFAGIMVPVILALLALGVWQVQRRAWKLALIAQVERRLAAAPIAPPPPAAWPHVGPDDIYTRIRAHGTYRAGADTYVQASTDLGPGYWVLTPMAADGGFTLLVDRGFVPQDMRGRAPAPATTPVDVTGLLRVSELRGGFLRSNDPAADRWYSRDVGAIAAKRGLGAVAPYFIDADASTSPGWPRGGLTVVRFPNNHLQYALTWFAMAALLGFATLRVAFGRPRR